MSRRLRWSTTVAVLASLVATSSAATTLDEMYAGRLFFDDDGRPLVSVRLMERQRVVSLVSDAPLTLEIGDSTSSIPANTTFSVEHLRGTPAKTRTRFVLETLEGAARLRDRASTLAKWRKRGVAFELMNAGGTYGVKGTVVDNRATVVVTKKRPPAAKLAAWGTRPTELVTLESLPAAVARVRIGTEVKAAPDGLVRVIAPKGALITVVDVEHSVGFSQHGRQTRRYRGEIVVAPDQKGLLAVVNVIPESVLISGVVPSETFASGPLHALKAQAVTARGELFAKIGRKFFADPYVTCSSQACQVYKGADAETARTNQAAEETAGELLFLGDDLVASVYSACCGGHTEPADVVWGTPPQSALIGRADVPLADPASRHWDHPVVRASLFASVAGHPEVTLPIPVDLRQEDAVRRFLAADRALTYCGRSTFNQKGDAYRWTRRFTVDDLSARFADLGVGRVKRLVVENRGPGGRLRSLRIEGEQKAARVDRELPVRRRLGLKSGLFVVDEERDARGALMALTLMGAGFGHGAGMCQQGAIGMAEAGHTYREILRHYYGGAEVRRVF